MGNTGPHRTVVEGQNTRNVNECDVILIGSKITVVDFHLAADIRLKWCFKED